jgi:hypothetical protein
MYWNIRNAFLYVKSDSKIYRILSLPSARSYLFKPVTSHQNINDILYALRTFYSSSQSPHPPQYT